MLTAKRATQIASGMLGYYEYLPSGTGPHPLIVFMHGVGQIGNGDSDLDNVLSIGLPMYLRKGLQLPAVIIMPQAISWSNGTQVNQVIEYAKKNYAIDATRIYATGLSMGGGAVWQFADAFADVAACVVPVCPSASPTEMGMQEMVKAGLGIIGYHANDDNICSVYHTITPITRLNEIGIRPLAEMTIMETGGHNIWDYVYDPAFGLYDKMFTYIKGASTMPVKITITSKDTRYLSQTRGGESSTVSLYGAPKQIANTIEQELYQYERWGDFTYTIPVPAGKYTLTMKFAEIWFNKPGDRKFNVEVNGLRVLDNFDMIAEAGKFTAIIKTFTATSINKQLVIKFSNNAKIAAIDITEGETPPPPNQVKVEAEFSFPGGKYTLTTDGRWTK
jgi:predicted esterase